MSAYSIINIELIKSMMNIPAEDTHKDNIFSICVQSGIQAGETYSRRSFNQEEITESGYIFNSDEINLSKIPIIEVAEVKIEDEVVEDFSLITSLGTILFSDIQKGNYEIKYTGGFEVLPKDLLHAFCLIIINHYTKFQKIADGANSISTADGTINYNRENIPAEAKEILKKYKRYRT